MTPTPGRPAIGPQITLRLPDEAITRLDQAAAHRDTTRANIIRTAIDTHLGAENADAPAQVWTWGPKTRDVEYSDIHDSRHLHHIAGYNLAALDAIVRLHDADWPLDMAPVWGTWAANVNNGNTWRRCLDVFTRQARPLVLGTTDDYEIPEWLSIHADAIYGNVTVRVGGAWGAMTPTYYGAAQGRIGYDPDVQANPDPWYVAARIIAGEIGADDALWCSTLLFHEAVELLEPRVPDLPETVVAAARGRWEEGRRIHLAEQMGADDEWEDLVDDEIDRLEAEAVEELAARARDRHEQYLASKARPPRGEAPARRGRKLLPVVGH